MTAPGTAAAAARGVPGRGGQGAKQRGHWGRVRQARVRVDGDLVGEVATRLEQGLRLGDDRVLGRLVMDRDADGEGRVGPAEAERRDACLDHLRCRRLVRPRRDRACGVEAAAGRGGDPDTLDPCHHVTSLLRVGTGRYHDGRVPAVDRHLHAVDALGLQRRQRPVAQVVLGRAGPRREQDGGHQSGDDQGREQPDETGPSADESGTRRDCRNGVGPVLVRGSGHCSSVDCGQ
jgi:hypothetical protein